MIQALALAAVAVAWAQPLAAVGWGPAQAAVAMAVVTFVTCQIF